MGVKERYEQLQKEGKEVGYSGVRQRYMANEIDNVASSITNRVNTWLENHNNYISNYQNRYSGRKYTYEDSYVSDSASWLDTVSKQKSNFDAEADSILSYMDQYKDYLDADWMKSVRDTLTSAGGTQSQILETATKDNEWWSSFNNEELIQQYGSAKDAYKTYQRYDGYSKKYTGQTSDEIQKALETLEDGEEKDWLNYNQYGLYKNDSSYNSQAASGWKSYEAQQIAAQEKEDAKPWWQKAVETFANAPADTSLPAAGITNAQAAYRNDTSYRHPNEKWSQDQKNHFGYLYSESPAQAYAYAVQVNNQINAEAQYEQQQAVGKWSSQNIGTGILGTLGAIATAPFGLADFLDNIVEYSARGTITQKGTLSPFDMGQAAQSGIANKLNEAGTLDKDLFAIGGKGWGDVYSLGVSAANSLVSAYTLGGTGTLISFIGQGGASGVDDALSRGATPEQALLYGSIVGAAEGVTEMINADNLLKIGSSSTLKKYLLKALNQGIGESIEEGASSVIGNIADAIIMQDKSNLNAAIEAYMDKGLSKEKATSKAWLDMVGDIAFDAMGGFITGSSNAMTVGAVKGVADTVKNYKTGSAITLAEGGVENLQNLAKNVAAVSDSKTQKSLNEKAANVSSETATGKGLGKIVAGAKNASNATKVGQLYDTVKSANNLANASANQADIAKSLERKGFNAKDANTIAQALVDSYNGKELTSKQQKLLDAVKNNKDVQAAISNIMNNEKSTMGQRSQNIRDFNEKVNAGLIANLLKGGTKEAATYKSLEERVGTENKLSVSESGQATIRESGEAIDLSKPEVVSFVTDKETGKITDMVLKVDGKEVKASEIDYADDSQSYLFEAVSNIENITPGAATAIIRDYDSSSGQTVGEYLNGMDEAYTYGYHGYSEADLGAGQFTTSLSNEQSMSAYKLGQSAKKIGIESQETAYKRMRTAEEAKQTEEQKTATQKARIESKDVEVYFEDGKTITKFDEHTGKYDDKRMAAVNTAKFLSKLGIGGKYYFYESYVKDGVRVYKDANGNEVEAPNGMYKDADGSIHIDLNAGDAGQGTALFTMGHELTHFIKAQSKKQFKVLCDLVKEAFDKTDMSMHERVLEKQKFLEDKRGEKVSYDEAYEEVVADAMSTMLTDGSFYDKLMEIKVKDKGLFNTIKRFFEQMIAKFKKVYEELTPDQKDAQDIRAMKDMFDKIQTAFAEALVEASENFRASEQALAESGIAVNSKTESGSLLSVRDVLKETDRQKVAKALAERFNVTVKEAMEWLKAETSLASIILNPKYSAFLDYEADPNEVAIKQNSDYPQGTVDFSNICKKRREFTQVMNRILRNFPNHVFAATDLAKIRTIMGEEGMTLPCGICYVEDRRQLDTIVAQDFIDGLKLYREGSKTRPDGKPFNANQLKGLQLTDGDTYVPTIYELVSLEGRNSLKAKNPNMEAAWVKYNNARGMQAVRLLTNEAEYKRQILKYSPKTVQTKNDYGGLRIYSFSDAEMFHLIDIVQVLTDCATVGLKVQGYTKVNEYAKAVKDTGEKLNRSLIPLGDLGYHMENGKVVLDYDTVEGIDITSKDFFDNKDNPDVGNITIGVNDIQIRAAMISDFVDQIIPFHTGQSEEVLGEKGIAAWKNYKDFQTEKDIATGKTSSHQVNIYTEVIQAAENEGKPIQNKRQFVEKFLEVCKENGLQPRFSDFLNTDAQGNYIYTEGYHKFLVDFKTFAQTEVGEYLPQMPVKPIFDDAYITSLLTDYVKEQKVKDAEVAKQMPKVIDRITNEIVKPSDEKRSNRDLKAEEVKYSTREAFYTEYDAWDKKDTNRTFVVGTTSEALQSVGMKDQNIVLRSGTVLQKINAHPEMTFDIFKGIPELLEHPVIVQFSDAIDSKTKRPKYDSSITVLGELYADVKEDGKTVKKPVLVSLELLPTNQKKTAVLDFAIIKSAYSKNALQQYLNENSILYIDPDKKRTDSWLSLNRLQLPLGENRYGPIRKIAYVDGKVKVQNSKNMTAMEKALFDAGVIDEFGQKIKTDPGMEAAETSYSDVMYSERVIDKKTLDFLNKQKTITTYKTMQLVDGKLYPPMASRINGAYEDYSELGVWEQATEHPELIKNGNKFKLDKGKGQGSIEAAYNPYMHSSNLVLNDQFSGAYTRDNLVTVECEVPVSELTSGYHAQYAKDSVGWHAWHTGTVAGSLRKARGIERQVFLSRWIKPVRIVPDAEVAAMYKDLLDGTSIAVPDNVVTPSLLKELRTAGVKIMESGRVKYSERNNAPIFYSQMGKVVEGMKQEKFGASSVISMLRGRGVKAEEIRWSGIHAFLDGKKSVTKAELLDFINGSMLQIEEETRGGDDFNEFMSEWRRLMDYDAEAENVVVDDKFIAEAEQFLQDAVDDGNLEQDEMDHLMDLARKVADGGKAAKWHDYKLDGGENYRELVFKMPDSTYSNTAMKGHWGEDAKGILAHARMQDFNTFIGKMLFIEEIQSDWHNEGQSKGYYKEGQRKEWEIRHETDTDYREFFRSDAIRSIDRQLQDNGYFNAPIIVARLFDGDISIYDFLERQNVKISAEERGYIDSVVEEEAKRKDELRSAAKTGSVPDAPFKNNYHEFVLKRLLRMAAEEGYDSIGWTTADIQSKRWSEDYAEGYRIEYDQDIPKFLKKYGKQWDTTVGKTVLDNGTEVWSMAITDSMQKSVLKEGQAMYSERGDGTSNRDLLANAFEGITKSSDEYELIQEYKGHIKLLNEYEEKLSKLNAEIRKITFDTEGERDSKKLKELQAKAKEVAGNINRHDKKLISLEASEPLRKVVERERKKEAQKTKEHVKEIQQNKKVRAEQTELRHKIRKTIRDLDKILNRGNKKQNVKDDLQPLVTNALKAADILFTENYGNYDMLRNGIGATMEDHEKALVESCAKMLKDLDKMPTDGYDNFMARQEAENRLKTKMSKLKSVFARERSRLKETEVSSILGELAAAYASLEDSEQSYVQGAYSEAVHNFLKNLQKEVGGTFVYDMTKDQLESVYAAYKMVLNTVRNANKMFNEELKQSREQLGNAVIEEVLKAGGVHLLGTKLGDAISQFDWNNMKPIWVANRIGSETFGKLMNGLFKGQYNFAVDIDEVKQFKLSMDEKYHPREWDGEKLYDFESSTGKKFSLNLQQIMSLYAFSKREQAYSHLLNGGFVFEDNSTVVVDGKLGIKKTYIHKGATSYKLNEATLNGIINSLTAEQKAYVDEMQKYLSEVMGAKGNEVSMKLYGIQMFKEQFYFPLRSSGAYMERAKEAEMKKQQGQINLVNSGFTHSVKPQAKNPIVLSGFMDVWAEHCNEMSMYHSMVLPMEDFRKVYNYTTVHDEKMESASVFQTIQDAYGKEATGYIDQLYRELNAGATVDPRETPWKKLISNFKKSAVILSGSVFVQQFSSIGRAYAVIDPKYFTGTKVNSDTKLSVVEEMKKYAPVAIIKEMGGFDTGTKGSAKSYIMAEQYGYGENLKERAKDKAKGLIKDEQYRGDLMGYLPTKADELTWCAIWEATKRETKAKHPDMDVKSEEFLKLAGDRFSEIIEKTQVYDSVLARSANMRSKGNFMAMATAFMAEPTTTVNLVEDAIRSGKAKNIARAFGSVAVSIILNNALASVVYAMRDDDEDETFLEKYFQAFTSGMIDDLNPMTYYPFLKDVYAMFQGYDVERADMSVIADVRDALKQVYKYISEDTSEMDDDKLAEHNKNLWGAFASLLDAGCSMFGVPVKNVRRDAMGIINAWNTISTDLSDERDNSWLSFWDKVGAAAKDTVPILAWTKDQEKTDKIYNAIVSGDKSYLGRLKSTYKTEDAYNTAVRKALRENDSRIHDAAQARYEGNSTEYKRIFREIQSEGKFTFDEIMDAVNAEENAIRNKLEPDKVTSSYAASDFVEAVSMGDTSSAKAIREDLISTYVANGKTQAEAEEAFASAVSTSTHDAYSAGLLDDTGAKNMLMEYADMDEEDATSRVNYWAFCNENPKYANDISEAKYNKYKEFAEPADISLDVFVQYINGTKGLSNIKDEWGNVEVAEQDQVIAVIDSLPLTGQQKDALFLAYGYKESSLWKVSW